MANHDLLRLVPDAPPELVHLLDTERGVLERPNRSEIFGPERFAQHGRSLGETHAAAFAQSGSTAFFPRLQDNIRILREANRYIGAQATTGYDMSPAAEWLLDNFHLIEAQLREIHDGLPRRYFRDLPVLQDEPLVGLPRVYGVAWAFVAHTDSAFDEDLLVHFLHAYEETRELTLGELWALPTTLRVVLIENLRRLAERAAASKAARELANLCCDHVDSYSPEQLDGVLARLNQRGVGEPFLAQMAQQLQDRHAPEDARFVDWLQKVAPHLAEIQTRLPAEQAADNLSVSNAIRSLRSIGDADWPEIVSSTSALTQLMLTSPAFAAERDDTRDQTLHAVESLARKSGQSERSVATHLLQLMHGESGAPSGDELDTRDVASFWLRGSGRPELLSRLGLPSQGERRLRKLMQLVALPAYLGAIATASIGVVVWLSLTPGIALVGMPPPTWARIVAGLLMLFPASEAVVAIVNRLISESARPERMPRLALLGGIPPEHRVMVVIPAMLTRPESGRQLAHQLQLHYLANPEREAQFVLLSDWADAAEATTPNDAPLLDAALAEIDRLNELYPTAAELPPRFALLHRPRRFAASERRWMGWERKRGKLEQLLTLLAEGGVAPFVDLGRASLAAGSVQYVVTLDSDTQLPPGRLRELVGVAAHPHNAPRLSSDGKRVERGYGILQPHVATPLPAPEDMTMYHWLFSGQSGIDPYSIASSEVYQDVFGEGTFAGKGLLHVKAVHAVLGGRLPENRVLSHDLLEGSLARCAAVTDITVLEEAPFHADVAASRVHRWTRGDWQLLPFLMRAGHYGLRAINRWKMTDNLRRSLVAPVSLLLLALALGSAWLSPVAMLVLIALAFTAGPLMGALSGLAPSRDQVAFIHFYAQAVADLGRAVASGAWLLAQLMQLALNAADAIGRALYRMTISHRGLLEWTTAAAAQASATTRLPALVRKHWGVPLAALVLWGVLLRSGTGHVVFATVLCAIWALSPVWTWWVSRSRPMRRTDALSGADRTYLQQVARDTWRLFERCVTAEEKFLPPDNLQTLPSDMVAHRTSPTNIGLYLLSTACAQRFGWIGSAEMIERIESTLATLETLPRHRGHFFNWYDTIAAAPLLPMYVSTVDSGNLCTHLLAVAQACLETRRSSLGDEPLRKGLAEAGARVAALRTQSGAPLAGDALNGLLALDDALAAVRNDSSLPSRIEAATAELAGWAPAPVVDAPPTAAHLLAWAIDDFLATLRSALRDGADSDERSARLAAIAATCQRLAAEPDFSFLFDTKRRLFHIGFRVAEHQLDAGYYDLLASEARGTSLWAIAKGDVSAAHWPALGRPFYAVGALAGLRSWSGSMFEYLMPSLVLDEPHGSVLHSATHAAVLEHMAFAREHMVPWGISESAYGASDHTLAYQYAPQGVPRLALRRTPADELVIAPYATALALQVAPHRGTANLHRLQAARARDRYGFIEALDYSPARQSGGDDVIRVRTFMAHHQGMSIVSLANVLLARAPRRWGMLDPRIEAVSSLLHERAPREVPPLRAAPSSPMPTAQRRAPGMYRAVDPGMAAIEPTHLLSNGRYAVSLRANGAGTSRWMGNAVSRSRDDALRDHYGTFFHLRWDRQPHAVSLTQHPAPDSAAHYESSFQADRVAFHAAWSEVDASVTVWVSPEDDIEFRRVVLRNTGDRVLDLELMSSFEVTLADPRADASHPAFSNLFLTAQWQPEHQALVFERKPRLAGDKGVLAANFLAEAEPAVQGMRVQVDRARWLGRNRDASHPIASFDSAPEATDGGSALLDTGLDPVSALAVRLQIAPRTQVRLTFCTAAADNATTLRAVIDKYRQHGNIERASMMSATLTGIRLREMRITADNFAAIQTLSTALAFTLTRAHLRGYEAGDVCDRRLLWRFGISGDKPIVLVSAGVALGFGMLRSLAQAARLWSWGGIGCDLVVVNHEPASYLMALSRQIAGLKEAYSAQSLAQPGVAEVGFHLLQSSDLQGDDLATLRTLARVRLNADGRPLSHHVQELVELHDRALEDRQAISRATLPARMAAEIVPRRAQGDFAATSGEFRFDVTALQRPARPWVNVLANPDFGAQLSEAGGGYSWAVNSSLNQLTPWSNDPVADPSGEWFLLQDMKTMRAWSVTASAAGDEEGEYRVAHGQGYSVISHRRGSLDVSASWCVDPATSVKQVRVRLINRGHKTLQLRVIGIAEWIMGANRGDRGSTSAHMAVTRAAASPDGAPPAAPSSSTAAASPELRQTVLLCTQRDRSAGFGGGTAFFGLTGGADEAGDWTCDRRESFDARGRVIVPDAYGQMSGCGLDPCAALASKLTLRGGESADRIFLLGYGTDHAAALALAESAALVPPLRRMQQVRAHWDELLGTTLVRTPDPLFDAMVNRWLLYQTLACRLWARAGFYQAGGAYGFRDQLQDSLALAWPAPKLLRAQIVLSASRQFKEGDVQHWWHAPVGAGVRTHFSDDLLWLPYAAAHYVQSTGDATLLDEPVPFLEGATIPEGAEDAYYAPTVSVEKATVYEHCARAIDRSLRVGAHGLPLMGTGDWNDGMNRVGHEGRGESVWLAWFLCDVVSRVAPLAEQRGDRGRASRWREAMRDWQAALQRDGWDGHWYRRAFFDNGSPLGSSENAECKIDLIAQAWAVLSKAAPEPFAAEAMVELDRHLVDHAAGLVKLLEPPLQNAQPSAGYIQAYPPGVRENGGQYSHAGVWAVMAQAERGDADAAYRYFTYLSPAHRSRDPERAAAYAIEPYVMAGDVYTAPPYVGRGGWSWYTGSAAWMRRAAIESIFGMQEHGDEIAFEPKMPSHWDQAEITLTRDGHSARVVFQRAGKPSAAVAATPPMRALQVGRAHSLVDARTRGMFSGHLAAGGAVVLSRDGRTSATRRRTLDRGAAVLQRLTRRSEC